MKLVILLVSIVLVSCSNHQVKRTKKNDKTLRIMVDPESAGKDYTKVVNALVSNGSFHVIDRKAGFKAVQKEQNRTHRHYADRYSNQQKFSHWGKLYGVGAIIVAESQCRWHRSFWASTKLRNRCELFLNLVDSNTGEIVVSVRDQNDSPQGSLPNWEETVQKLSEAFPRYFTDEAVNERLKEYMNQSERNYKKFKKPKTTWILPHDDNFDKNGKLLSPEEVLKRVSQ